MTTAISIEDVRREVKILRALSGHKHLVKFHDACEDANNVYIAMEYVLHFPFDFGNCNILLLISRFSNQCQTWNSFKICENFD